MERMWKSNACKSPFLVAFVALIFQSHSCAVDSRLFLKWMHSFFYKNQVCRNIEA